METKNKIFTVILVIILIGLFVLIFQFSSQDGGTSKGLSRRVTETFVSPITGIDKLKNPEKEHALEKADVVVRKIAHFSLYFLVGADAMAIMVVATGNRTRKITKFGCAFGTGVVYAISDEIHQIFTSGRAGMITDVVIDAMRCLDRNFLCFSYCNNCWKYKKT